MKRKVPVELTETEWERVLQSLELTKAISRYAGDPFGVKYQQWHHLQKKIRVFYGIMKRKQ